MDKTGEDGQDVFSENLAQQWVVKCTLMMKIEELQFVHLLDQPMDIEMHDIMLMIKPLLPTFVL